MKNPFNAVIQILCLIFLLNPSLSADVITEPIRTFNGHTDSICPEGCVVFSPDGQYALSGSWDNTLKLWEVATGTEIRTFRGHSDYVYSVAFSADGRYALSGSRDNTLKLWEVATGTEIRTLRGHSSIVYSVAFSPDGHYLLSGSGDNTLKLWEFATGAEIRSLTGHSFAVTSVAFSPDGRYALSGSYDKTLKLWKVDSGIEIRTFTGHSDSILSLAFSPDGQYLLSGSRQDDKTLKLWKVDTGEEIRTFHGHYDSVWSVAFSPDGHHALSGSSDGTVKLWEVATGTQIRTFTGHTDYVHSVAFSPDSRYALSGARDNSLKLWETGLIATPPPNTRPTAALTLSTAQGTAPLSVTLDASASTDPDGTITQYHWSTSDGQTTSGKKATITFPEAGTYTINLVVTDDKGSKSTNTAKKTVFVEPAPKVSPAAKQKVSPTQGQVPLTVSLNASQSTDSDGTIVKYLWDISDGRQVAGRTQQIRFDNAGTYTITLTVTDNDGLTANTQQTITVSEPEPPEPDDPIPGQAIIIAGPSMKDTLFEYSNEFTQRMYRLLKQRGYNDDKIHYLNVLAPDIEPFDGRIELQRQDYELLYPETELADAFAQASAQLKAGEQFVFYLHAHAHPDATYLVNYELSASRLRELLATIPTDVQQIIILDTCYSGSFIDDLSGVPNRVVVTSTNDKSKTWQVARSSFADEFLRMLQSGGNLLEAFQAAQKIILNLPDLFYGQRPWLDDDGDGQFLNDGLKAEQIFVGRRKIEFAAPLPKIQSHELITLPDNTSTATLWVRTIRPSHKFIHRVRAILLEPNYQVSEYQGKNTEFDQQELELIYNADKKRYEIAYSGFMTAGRWRILYQAQDVEGNWSEQVQGEVQAPGLQCNPCVKTLLNQSRYTTGAPISLDMMVNGTAAVDLYVAIVFPDGYFITVAYPLNFSSPDAIQVYRPNIEITDQQTFAIMNFPVPTGIAKGQYAACGVLVKAGSDPNDQHHWKHKDCLGFEVY